MSRRHSNHYEALGISQDADQEQIRSAFRRKAKEHHPDLCDDGDADAFRRAQQAYETLRDPRSRRAYDAQLRRRERGDFGPGDPGGGFGPGGFGGGFDPGMDRGGMGRGGGRSTASGFSRRSGSSSPFDDLQDMFEELFGAAFGGGAGFSPFGGGATRERGDTDWAYSDEGTDAGAYAGYRENGPVEFDVHMSPDEAFTGVTAHLHLDHGGTVVVDIPPGVRDGHTLQAQFRDRFGPRELRLNIHIV
jgi:molecular chaperone DnaJ